MAARIKSAWDPGAGARGCGWQGMAARFQSVCVPASPSPAVVCRESPLGYSWIAADDLRVLAVDCRESPLGYSQTVAIRDSARAVGRSASPLGYTQSGVAHGVP